RRASTAPARAGPQSRSIPPAIATTDRIGRLLFIRYMISSLSVSAVRPHDRRVGSAARREHISVDPRTNSLLLNHEDYPLRKELFELMKFFRPSVVRSRTWAPPLDHHNPLSTSAGRYHSRAVPATR